MLPKANAKLLRRQELERMEKERGIRIFLTPEEAVSAAALAQPRSRRADLRVTAGPRRVRAREKNFSVCKNCIPLGCPFSFFLSFYWARGCPH